MNVMSSFGLLHKRYESLDRTLLAPLLIKIFGDQQWKQSISGPLKTGIECPPRRP